MDKANKTLLMQNWLVPDKTSVEPSLRNTS